MQLRTPLLVVLSTLASACAANAGADGTSSDGGVAGVSHSDAAVGAGGDSGGARSSGGGGQTANGAGTAGTPDSGVGETRQEAVVIGTSTQVYAMFGGGAGPKDTVDTAFEVGDTTAGAKWTMPGTPKVMTLGPGQAALTNNGTYNIVIMANYNAGLWRYFESI